MKKKLVSEGEVPQCLTAPRIIRDVIPGEPPCFWGPLHLIPGGGPTELTRARNTVGTHYMSRVRKHTVDIAIRCITASLSCTIQVHVCETDRWAGGERGVHGAIPTPAAGTWCPLGVWAC